MHIVKFLSNQRDQTMETAKQIDVRNINGIRGKFKKPEARFRLARIVGIAHFANEKTTADLSTVVKFDGEFLATNASGEQVLAPSMVLPGEASDALHAAITKHDRSVQFGYDFFLNPDGKLETVTLINIEPSKALHALADAVNKAHAAKAPEAESNGTKRTPTK